MEGSSAPPKEAKRKKQKDFAPRHRLGTSSVRHGNSLSRVRRLFQRRSAEVHGVGGAQSPHPHPHPPA